MSNTPHELIEELPEFAEKITDLKQSNKHFARLLDDYHELNREVHRAETDVEPTDDLHLTEMRKKRLALKDGIVEMLQREATGKIYRPGLS